MTSSGRETRALTLLVLAALAACAPRPPAASQAPDASRTTATPANGPAPSPPSPAPLETDEEDASEPERQADDRVAPTEGAVAPAAPALEESPAKRRPPRRKARVASSHDEARETTLGASSRTLERAARARASDCPSAQRLEKAICDLAERICGLVDRDPNVASVQHYCDDARQRCQAAGQRTAERCDE